MIDRNPLVGRIVVRQSLLRDEYFRRAGTIVRVTGYRVFYESIPGMTAYMSRKNIAAVCNTQDEVDKLLAFDREMRERRVLARKQEQLELKRRFGL